MSAATHNIQVLFCVALDAFGVAAKTNFIGTSQALEIVARECYLA